MDYSKTDLDVLKQHVTDLVESHKATVKFYPIESTGDNANELLWRVEWNNFGTSVAHPLGKSSDYGTFEDTVMRMTEDAIYNVAEGLLNQSLDIFGEEEFVKTLRSYLKYFEEKQED